MAERNDFGRLITPSTKLQRDYFRQMCDLIGVYVQFYAPKDTKTYNIHGELESKYKDPVRIGCIFAENIDQSTAKKLGWNSELQDHASIIHLPYDLEGLEVGALVDVPSAYDNTPSRKFRVTKMSAISIYPASIACELVQEYETEMMKSETELFRTSNFNLLWDDPENKYDM